MGLDPTIRVGDERCIAQRSILGDPVVTSTSNHDVVIPSHPAHALNEVIRELRQELPIVRGDCGGRHFVIGDCSEEPRACELREKHEFGLLFRRALYQPLHMIQILLEGPLRPKLELNGGYL
ncbi:hypothetical protein [Arthrobacter sp. StoSoilB13]|uniref:hypothetical protein n=1 Tax=Arthrobacter sp. StoSoilB13 TaxID=2830993 RepID=UPI0021E114DF|nr:hypothetical protein [Arthrobacter sp. StoSoilB13]